MTDHHHTARWRLPVAVFALALGISACATGTGQPSAPPDSTDAGSPPASMAEAEGLLGELQAAGVIRVANTQANPPYSFVDESNEVVGYDVDVANAIAERLGIGEVQFVQGTFQTFIEGLKTDKWDIVISGLTPTDERKLEVDFTCPYQVNGVSIFVHESNTTINGEEDLEGQRIAVTAGGTQEQLAQEIPDAEVLSYENSILALTDVGVERADAYLGSRFTGVYQVEVNGLAVKAIEGLLNSEANAIAIAKEEEAFVSAVNEALVEMMEDGTLTEISQEWLAGEDIVDELDKLPEC